MINLCGDTDQGPGGVQAPAPTQDQKQDDAQGGEVASEIDDASPEGEMCGKGAA